MKKNKHQRSNTLTNSNQHIVQSNHTGLAKQPRTEKSIRLHWTMALIPAMVVFVCVWLSLSVFPYTQCMMEHLDFFVSTDEFLLAKLTEYPGVNSVVTSWLLQFFGIAQTGAVIEAMLLAIVALFAALLPLVWFGGENNGRGRCRNVLVFLAVLPSLGLLMLFMHRVELDFEALYFYISLFLVGLLRTNHHRWLLSVAVALLGVASFGMLAFPMTVMLMLAVAFSLIVSDTICGQPLTESLRQRWIVTGVCLLVVVATVVALSTSVCGFVPFDKRWWHIPGVEGKELQYLLLMALPVVLMFVPRLSKTWVQIGVEIVCSIVVAIGCYNNIANNEEYQTTETVYRYADYAERGEWQTLLDEIRGTGQVTNTLYMQWTMLAEAKLGSLPTNIFSYSINTPELFCPRFEGKPYATDFCRIFYRELGVVDEAFHQAFEYGMKVSSTSGFCFASLRHMAEYSVKMGDKKLADKYLSLLSKTSCHADFVDSQRKLLKTNPVVKDSLRSDDFIKAFHFDSEMAHLLDYNRNNKVARDYLLCGLLLTKNLEIFKTVLLDFSNTYNDAELPRAYAEAAAMINHLAPGIWSGKVTYSSEYDKQFEQFMSLHNNHQDDSAFQGTFWYYYVYAEIPAIADWQNSGHAATS